MSKVGFAMASLPGLLKLQLRLQPTAQPGDNVDDPLVVESDDDDGVDVGDGDEVQVTNQIAYETALATRRLTPLVAPGLVVKKVVKAGREMRGLFAARALKKCEAIGVYDGEARLPTMNTTAQPTDPHRPPPTPPTQPTHTTALLGFHCD